MSNTKVRIFIWTTSSLTGVLTLLYLPMLIWSPPWGENGYYLISLNKYQYFINGEIRDISIDRHFMLISNKTKFIRKQDYWVGRYGLTGPIALKVQDAKMYLGPVPEENEEFRELIEFPKLSAPILIWKLKYKEWTH